MLFSIITPVFAQSAGGGSGQSLIMNLAPFALIFVVMYFMMIRPQQKRMKEHQNMVNSLKRGDRVVALGGLVGTIAKIIDDKEADITVGTAELRVLKSSINSVVDKSVDAQDKKSKMKVVTNLKKK